MPRDINVTLLNRRLTGVNVSVPQRAVDYAATFTKDDGTPGSDSGTILFPNILADNRLPAGWLADELEQLCYRAKRIIAGIDQP